MGKTNFDYEASIDHAVFDKIYLGSLKSKGSYNGSFLSVEYAESNDNLDRIISSGDVPFDLNLNSDNFGQFFENKDIKQNVDRIKQYINVQKEAIELFRKKNQDYGDAFANYGTVGVLVRLGDKIARCQSISNKGISLVQDEKLRDTLIDLHNYAAMAIMLLDEDKK